jgi:hypothetical protein
MRILLVFFLFCTTLCSAQTVEYDLVTRINVTDETLRGDTLYAETGKFIFHHEQIIHVKDSTVTGYPILGKTLKDNRLYFNSTNFRHEYILISSENFIGGTINIATLKDDKTVILSYLIKKIE